MTEPLDHLEPATIAALVERTLDPGARRAAEAHLAVCADCREVWVETSEMVEVAGDTERKPGGHAVIARRIPMRRWMYAGTAIAATVLVAVGVWNYRRSSAQRAVAQLAAAAGSDRTVLARLSGPFQWGPPPDVVRGPASERPLAVREAAAVIERLAETRSADNLAALGKAQLILGMPDEAIESLGAALRADSTRSDARVDLSAAHLEMWRRTGDASAATRALDEAERAIQLDPQSAEAIFNKARAAQALGLKDAARRAWHQYLTLDSVSQWADEARAELARLDERSSGDSESTRTYRWIESTLLPSWARAALEGRSVALTQGLQAATTLRLTGRDQRPAELLDMAIASDGWPAPRRACLARGILALPQWDETYEKGDYAEAGRLVTRIGDGCPSLLESEVGLRRVLLSHARGQTFEAGAESAVLLDRYRDRHLRIAARLEQIRGIAALSRVHFGEGLARYEAALDLATRAADDELTAVTHGYLAAAYGEQGDHERAWSHFASAFAGLDRIESPRRRYVVVANAARVAEETGWAGAALGLSRELLVQTEGWRNAGGRVVALLGEARTLAALGAHAGSDAVLVEARRAAEEIHDASLRNEFDAEIAATAGRLLVARDPSRAIESLTAAMALLERRDNHFRTAGLLLARGRAHRNRGDGARAQGDWLRGIELIETQSATISTGQLRASRLDEAWELFDELIAERAEQPAEALAILERGLARELFESISKGRPDMGRTTSFEWLPSSARVVAYAALPERLLIWEVTARGISQMVRRDVRRDALADRVNEHVRLVSAGGSPTASGLAELLLPDEILAHPPELLIVIPDGPLHQLPFATLVSSGRASLVERTVVAYAPSLAVLRATSERPGQYRDARALLIQADDASAAERLPRLPGVEREIAQLESIYDGPPTLRGRGADWKSLKHALPSASIVHFAGHAIADPLFPSRSRLLLSPADPHGPVTIDDLSTVNLKPGALVVLAACETARGRVFKGEGAQTLARPFLARGSSAVLATFWPIADSGSTALLVRFHELIRSGSHPALALADAQRTVSSRGVPQRVWGAFGLIGIPRWSSPHGAAN